MSQHVEINVCYEQILGGCTPCGDNMPQRLVTMIAEDILDTPNINTLFCVHDGYLYYLSLPSRLISSLKQFETPLAKVLPSHPEHKGDGVYRVNLYGRSHIAIKFGTSLKVMSNSEEVIDDYIASNNMRVFDVTNSKGEILLSIPSIYRIKVEAISKSTQKIMYTLIFVFTLILSWSEIIRLNIFFTPEKEEKPLIDQTIRLANEHKKGNPVNKDIERMESIAAITIRAGGWIEEYRKESNGSEHFLVMLPEWVSRDYIEELGAGVTTDKTSDGLIQARKGSVK